MMTSVEVGVVVWFLLWSRPVEIAEAVEVLWVSVAEEVVVVRDRNSASTVY